VTGYLRRDLLERHLWRTGLRADVELVAEPTALAICGRALSESDARGLLEMCGLIHPDGPGKVDVRVTRPRLTGAAPVRNAHRKRSKL
jgi:hypothetical protein